MVKVRFAPSPTGRLHLGSLRTALYNWLYAKHTGGKFVLRIEDTDTARSKEEYLASIIEDLKWLGLDYDEFYKQSERFDIYLQYAEKLVKERKAYYCTCEREDILKRQGTDEVFSYDGFCRGRFEKPDRPYVIRLLVERGREINFFDQVKKELKINTDELDDFVIIKQDLTPTYNFAVVVDDAEMGITHIIRGEDHITNTFKQLIVYGALGFKPPEFAHLPLVFGKDRKPLSKRLGSTDVEYYKRTGIIPEALINAVARLGWGYKDVEIFTVDDLIEKFDIKGLNSSNAIYDEEKILFYNSRHIKQIEIEKLIKHFKEFVSSAGLILSGRMEDEKWLKKAILNLRERHSTLKTLYDEMLIFAIDEVRTEKSFEDELNALLNTTKLKDAFDETREYLLKLENVELLERNVLEKALREIAEKYGVKFGDLVRLLRLKLCGSNKSPDIITVLYLLGEKLKKRL
ncbi:MAG: glutamate--tRNA ligase [Brevinematia bacterium]